MGLDKRKRCAIGLGLLAIGALAADRVFILPGPASASAEEIPLETNAGEPVDLEQLEALASNLANTCKQEAPVRLNSSYSQSTADPFEAPWHAMTVTDAAVHPTPDTQSASQPIVKLPVLSAVVSVGGRGYAVLNGKPLAVGGSRNGYTLTELTDLAATISIQGSVYTLPLRPNNSSP